MNTKSLIITAFVAFIFISVSDFVIHAVWLSSTYGATKELWRSEAEMASGAMMGWMFFGKFVIAAAFSLIFASFVAEKRNLGTTLKFSLLIAMISVGGQIIMYSVQPFPGMLTLKWSLAGIVQMGLLGLIVHKVYRLPAN